MRTLAAALLVAGVVWSGTGFAGEGEPTIYTIKKGDTLWSLSEKFFKDPFYWPNLWSLNQDITNPHILEPGEKVRVYSDHIERVEPKREVTFPGTLPAQGTPAPGTPAQGAPAPGQPSIAEKRQPSVEEAIQVYSFSGSEGYLLEKALKPTGFVISTYQNRQIVGEDDVVYTDIGRVDGARPGDRFDIYKKMGAISHPITNVIVGYKVVPLGVLQLSEVQDKVSKAIIAKSYQEISAGSFLLPYHERRKEVALKGNAGDLAGYIVESQTGNKAVAAGDLAFLDIGRRQGAEVGNMLYVVRGVELDQKFVSTPVGKPSDELIGAVVIVETGEDTSTAIVVKSIDTIYRGDRVELKKGK